MRRWLRYALLLFAIVLCAYTGVSVTNTSQILTHADLYAMGSSTGNGTYQWNGATTWSSTDGQGATYSDFTTHFYNTGSCGGSTSQLISKGSADSCKYLTSAKTALSNSFATTCSGWTFAGVTGTGFSSVAPVCGTTGDYDADTNFSQFTTTSGVACYPLGTTQCEGTSAYTFSISTPASISSATISFQYKGNAAAATGDSVNCSATAGNVGLSLKVNSTSVTLPTLTFNAAWQPSGSVTVPAGALVTGNNTITFTQHGQNTYNQTYNVQTTICNTATYTNNYVYVDNIVVSATY